MDAIPFFRFGSILVLAGILMYAFNNIVIMILPQSSISSGDVVYIAMMMVWHGILAVVVLKETAHFIMTMQKRSQI